MESRKGLGLSENHTQSLSCPHLEPKIGELKPPKASLLHPSPSFAAVPELLGHERPKRGLCHTHSHLNHPTDTIQIQKTILNVSYSILCQKRYLFFPSKKNLKTLICLESMLKCFLLDFFFFCHLFFPLPLKHLSANKRTAEVMKGTCRAAQRLKQVSEGRFLLR